MMLPCWSASRHCACWDGKRCACWRSAPSIANSPAAITLFRIGDEADCGYVVQRGAFRVTLEDGSSAETIAGPGTLIGELALIVPMQRPATAVSLEFSTVIRLARIMFSRRAGKRPRRRPPPARRTRRPHQPDRQRYSDGGGEAEYLNYRRHSADAHPHEPRTPESQKRLACAAAIFGLAPQEAALAERRI